MPRKYPPFLVGDAGGLPSFNEAGADAPEIHDKALSNADAHTSFNEAGADAPEIQRLCLC